MVSDQGSMIFISGLTVAFAVEGGMVLVLVVIIFYVFLKAFVQVNIYVSVLSPEVCQSRPVSEANIEMKCKRTQFLSVAIKITQPSVK